MPFTITVLLVYAKFSFIIIVSIYNIVNEMLLFNIHKTCHWIVFFRDHKLGNYPIYTNSILCKLTNSRGYYHLFQK